MKQATGVDTKTNFQSDCIPLYNVTDLLSVVASDRLLCVNN